MPELGASGAGPTGLAELARASIAHGLRTGAPLEPALETLPAAWRTPAAVFVTLREGDGGLRGCVGSLEAAHPLARAVSFTALRAATGDPRFAPLREDEIEALHIHVSVLGPLEPIDARSESELVAALRAGIDGLVLREGDRHAAFLPAVWEQLPEPLSFVRALQQKAGFPPGYWTRYTEALRFATRDVGR